MDKQVGNILGLTVPSGLDINRNLLDAQDASLEATGVGNWTARTNADGLARSETQEKFGSASLTWNTTAAGDTSVQAPGTGTDGIPVEASKEYTALAWLFGVATAEIAHVTIFWWQSDGTASAVTASVEGPNISLTNAWNLAHVTADSPSDAAFATVAVTVEAAALGDDFFVDGVSLHRGNDLNWKPGGAEAQTEFDAADFGTVAKMRARLKAIDSTLYTDTYLNTMTYNDMVYAVRLSEFPESIND